MVFTDTVRFRQRIYTPDKLCRSGFGELSWKQSTAGSNMTRVKTLCVLLMYVVRAVYISSRHVY